MSGAAPRPSPRSSRALNALGFAACAAMLGFAYYSQYVLKLEPCPLCIFQRIGIFALGCAFLTAAVHAPRRWGARVYAGVMLLFALATAAVAIRHLYIQSLPEGSVPACGASLKFMLKVLPLHEVLSQVLSGSGECAKVTWRLLGLSMPAWVLIGAAGLGALGFAANRGPRRAAEWR